MPAKKKVPKKRATKRTLKNVGIIRTLVKKKKPDKDLNARMKDDSRKQQNVFVRGKKKIHIIFDGGSIKSAVIRMVNKPATAFVVGCIAWLSNKDILKAMATKKGCCIVCTKDKLTKGIRNQTAYSGLKPAYPGGAVRVVGGGSGWHKSLMHHKFLVGLDTNGIPIWVTNGSFNMTENATTNLENLMIMEDAEVAKCYFDEFKRVHALSTELKLKV